MRLLGLISVILIFQSQAHAAYNRLWVGFKKEEITTADFMNGLNKIFFEKTINVGKGKGLLAYQPYVTMMNADLPHEIALVTYQDEASYKAIRATKEGEEYSALHWDYFDKGTSKSAVPVPYEGAVSAETAYELKPAFTDWQSGDTYVNLYEAPVDIKKLVNEIELLKSSGDVNNSIFMIKGKWLMEYRSLKSSSKGSSKLELKVLEHRKLASKSLSKKTLVDFGEGVNFKF